MQPSFGMIIKTPPNDRQPIALLSESKISSTNADLTENNGADEDFNPACCLSNTVGKSGSTNPYTFSSIRNILDYYCGVFCNLFCFLCVCLFVFKRLTNRRHWKGDAVNIVNYSLSLKAMSHFFHLLRYPGALLYNAIQ